jgi:hypothetical protein
MIIKNLLLVVFNRYIYKKVYLMSLVEMAEKKDWKKREKKIVTDFFSYERKSLTKYRS